MTTPTRTSKVRNAATSASLKKYRIVQPTAFAERDPRRMAARCSSGPGASAARPHGAQDDVARTAGGVARAARRRHPQAVQRRSPQADTDREASAAHRHRDARDDVHAPVAALARDL